MRYCYALFFILSLVFVGCDNGEKKISDQSFSSMSEMSAETKAQNQNLDKQSYQGLENVFQDSSELQTYGKYLMIVFGKNNCGYCDKLKEDIKSNQALQKMITDHFSPYYINISYEKEHHLLFSDHKNQKEATLLTSELAGRIYQVYATPTIIFGDSKGKTIFIIPGYIPSQDFQKVLEFIVNGKWKKAKDIKERNKLLSEYLRD